MTKDLKATKFHRKCDAMRISEEDRAIMWKFVTETETDLDDPMIEFVVLVGLAKIWLETHRKLLIALPNSIDRILGITSAKLERRIEAKIEIAAGQVAKEAANAQVQVVRAAIADHAIELSNAWRATSIASCAGLAFIACLLSYMLGYTSHLPMIKFWGDLLTTSDAINWRQIIEANPKLPASFAACGLDPARAFPQDSSSACSISLWTTSPSFEHSWLDRLISWPASLGLHVAPTYLVVSFLSGVALTLGVKCLYDRVSKNE